MTPVRCNGQRAYLLSLKACSKVHSVSYTDVYLNDHGLEPWFFYMTVHRIYRVSTNERNAFERE